jgi:lysozyme
MTPASRSRRTRWSVADGTVILVTVVLIAITASIGSRFLVRNSQDMDPELVPAGIEVSAGSPSPLGSLASNAASSASPAVTPSPVPSRRLSPTLTPSASPEIHVVRFGETLTSIARRYGTTVTALVELNEIDNPSLIRVGQQILIPAS